MLRGIYTSVSGMGAADRRQQVLANNIANAGTPGFRADDVTAESFDQIFTALWDPLAPGTGAEPAGRRFDLSQGPVSRTGAPLDVALEGNGFFALTAADGQTVFTRAGRFTRDAGGVLRSPDGSTVQGIDGGPITATGAAVRITEDGTVLSDGAVAGRLRLVSLDPTTMQRTGTATLTGTVEAAPATPKVVSGALEGSNVDVTATMTTMSMLMRAFEAGRQAVQLQNETLNQTVNQVGRL